MRIKIFCLLACLLSSMLVTQSLHAQYARFVESGVITFEKRVNMYAKIQSRYGKSKSSFMEQAFEQYKRTQPQFKTFNYNLAFDGSRTRFWPLDDQTTPSGGFFGDDPSIDMGNTIVTDLLKGQSTSQKSIYEETYLITDS